MELSEEAKQSYMKFCKVSPKSKLSNNFVRVEVSYDPTENAVRVLEKGRYNYYGSFNESNGFIEEEVYDFKANTYDFQMLDETTLKYHVSKYGYHRQGSDDDGSTGPEDTSFTPETEEIDTYYRVPENFKLEDGLDSTKMEEIKEYNSSKTR